MSIGTEIEMGCGIDSENRTTPRNGLPQRLRRERHWEVSVFLLFTKGVLNKGNQCQVPSRLEIETQHGPDPIPSTTPTGRRDSSVSTGNG
jgi:hypothetical protein